jgi:putative toxin-antitoxin system antitoxin component (TIGR02293 family)
MATQSTLAGRLRGAAERTDLDQADFAQLLGTNPRTVARWLAEETEPRTDARRRLLEVLAVLEQLSVVMRPQAAHDWLFSPNPLLGHDKPIDLLARGEWRRVLGLIDALEEGVFV